MSVKASKVRADERLVHLALVESRNKAQALIMRGKVEYYDERAASWKAVEKAGQQISETAALRLVGEEDKYVGRGAYKLLQALESWPQIPSSGARCLDIGSSTGGFTQVLLERGATHVVALDVGTNQLHEKLRSHAGVLSLEKQHVLKMDEARWREVGIEPSFDIIVSDLSFISLTKIIPHAWAWLRDGGHWVMLVKPQFELEPSKVPRGIVKDPKHRKEALDKVVACILNCPLARVNASEDCRTQGAEGNTEYLLWVTKN
ncbi:MAG TPA: TlyA family RNA methyltransferase [Bdellovibrionota bacterium]|nr:TlyA family RNA methyltransferase [Bdellovibrionota bacterium]